MQRIISIAAIVILTISICSSQTHSNKSSYVNDAHNNNFQTIKNGYLNLNTNLSINERILYFAKIFLERPYVAKTLEEKGVEKLIVNFDELDCTTYLETVVALTLASYKGDFTFTDYCQQLTNIRYRDCKIDKYPSRLHYFSEWIINNTEKGYIETNHKNINNSYIEDKVSFMSNHPQYYTKIKNNKLFLEQIIQQEININNSCLYYTPKDKIKNFEQQIQSGSLIAITTSIEGLIISHVGFAYRKENRVYFIHASSKEKKVVISEKPLYEYLKTKSKNTGIIVCKVINPKL